MNATLLGKCQCDVGIKRGNVVSLIDLLSHFSLFGGMEWMVFSP